MGQAAVYEAPWACLASGPHCSQRNLFGSWRCGSCTHARTCLYEAALLQLHPSNVKAAVETRQVYSLVLLLKGLLVRMLAPTTSARLCSFCQYNTSHIDAQPSLKLATLLLLPVRCLESCC